MPGGNTLQNYGSNLRLREVTPDGAVVWDVQWPTTAPSFSVVGRSVMIEDLYALAP